MSDPQVKSIIERILRLHAESDELAADIREVYGEAKANGYDKTALGAAVRTIRQRDKIGESAIAERETIVGLYLAAYDGPSRTHVHVPAREATYPERVSRPSESAGRASSLSGNAADQAPDALTPENGHVDRSASAQPHSAEGKPAILNKAGDARTGQAVCDDAAEAATLEQPSGAETGSAVRAGAPFVISTAKPLRPHCQNRDACGSYGSKHCGPCLRAAGLTEAA